MPFFKPHKPTPPASDGVSTGSSPPGAQRNRPAGRIIHDERGNARWQPGGEATHTDSTSRVLRSLDVPDLAVEGQEELAHQPTPPRPDKPGKSNLGDHNPVSKRQGAPMVDAGGGYNPYDLTVPVKKKPLR